MRPLEVVQQQNTVLIADYATLNLLELAACIADDADHAALNELHRRTFIYGNNRRLRVSEFIENLAATKCAHQWCRCDPLAVDMAYDLTISKFSNLPDHNQHVKSSGPDCRYYFRAFVNYAAKTIKMDTTGHLEVEQQASQLLQKFIVRHFYLSCLECTRKMHKTIYRYLWNVKDAVLPVWMPSEMSAKNGRQWLEENITDLNPTRPGEVHRIQELADRLLRKPAHVLARGDDEDAAIGICRSPVDVLIERELAAHGLEEYVAQEKADTIELQRRAIQTLGKDGLKALIRRIFEVIASGDYQIKAIASEFGLSEPTLSRFAGHRWIDKEGKIDSIPDLWVNTARVVARHQGFVEAAQKACVFACIQKIDAVNSVE